LDLARSDQSDRWRQGSGVQAEAYFAELPELLADTEEQLVLICGEIQLRREVGELPTVDEYRARFPGLSEEIALQFDVDRIFEFGAPELTIGKSDGVESIEAVSLPGYEFLKKLGSGAAGVVYQARQISLDRHVAVKVLLMPASDPKRLARQRQEAEILARLRHPNVVHVYEVVEHCGCLYLVMEFIDGPTLKDFAAGNPLEPLEAAQLVLTLAETMQAVHEAGVLHRDLKPSNVLVPPSEQIRITDFGLAKLRTSDNLLTTEDSVLGTPSYMSPEQAMGNVQTIEPQTDVYSLGAILYELLTGRPPFLGATVLDTLALIREQPPVPPRHLQPGTPRDLQTICLKCLEKAPSQRYITANALAEDLRRFRDGLPILARPPHVAERLARTIKRKPAATAAVVCAVLLIGVIGAALWLSFKQQQRLSATALVESIVTADAQTLSRLLPKLSDEQRIALPLLRAKRSAAKPNDPKWFNLSVAELATDASASSQELVEYLPASRPSEIPVIVQTLLPRFAALQSDLWSMLLAETVGDEARLRLACLVANGSADDPRWSSIAPAVTRALVHQNPLDMGTFTALLAPVRNTLIGPLAAMCRRGEIEPLPRIAAIGVLARFGEDQPGTLVELIAGANADEFHLLLPPLMKNREAAEQMLQAVASRTLQFEELTQDKSSAKHDVDRIFDDTQRQRATAAIAIWHLGKPDAALRALGGDVEPAMRAWIIELLAPLGVSVEAIWQQSRQATDAKVRQALVLTIGQANLHQLSVADKANLIEGLLEMYGTDADAGVHSACRWLLKNRLTASDEVNKLDDSLKHGIVESRNWYVGPNGHSFVLFRGSRTFKMGSPQFEPSREEDEQLHDQVIDHSFAISSEEVTIAQCRRRRERFFNLRYSPTEDCPANNVTWFDTAAYCRALSEEEGIPEDQMCYPPVPKIGPGMRLPDNWLQRTGYRLPTEAEWEFACRGGVSASRFCGEGEQLPTRYAWYLRNSDNHAWPVGRLKPNNYGLFDMLGNVAERCHDAMEPIAPDSTLVIRANDKRAFRGGNFGDIDQNLRSARRSANSADDQWALTGFRVARTFHGKLNPAATKRSNISPTDK
jgi:serine/threonine protein kinase/formylglycine-generating enzyme required for sulfatase activity